MKVVLIPAVAIGLLCSAGALLAQEPTPKPSSSPPTRPIVRATGEESLGPHFTMGELTPTPDMWFYEQRLREYRSPKNSVRRRAEFQADQRQKRIAAMDWFGLSNSRPTVNITPFTGSGPYSPTWAGSSTVPFQWNGSSRPMIVVPVQESGRAAYGLW
jgi:hypothetical protein